MAQIDQLIAKALSTSSEDEAIACLRMARKQGKTAAPTKKEVETYAGGTAEQWAKNAKYWKHSCESANAAYATAVDRKKQADVTIASLERTILGLIITIPVVITIAATIVIIT